jgi:hypothetical protein
MNAVRNTAFQLLAAALLLAQAFAIIRMPFVEDRFFCWSPHDSRTDLQISAYRGQFPVPAQDVEARYGLPAIDWHSAGNVKQVIRTAESRHADHWQVRIHYRRNLDAGHTWTFPPE